MVKHGALRTAESLMAIALSFGFLFFMLQSQSITPGSVDVQNVLHPLRSDTEFRTCVLERDTTCIETIVEERLGPTKEYTYNISTDPTATVSGLPARAVVASSVYIGGNISDDEQVIFRLFTWDS